MDCSKSNTSYFIKLVDNVRGGDAVVPQKRLNLSSCIPLHSTAVWQMAAEGQSDKMAYDMEVHMKQRWVIDFLYMEEMAPTDIHWHLLNIYGDKQLRWAQWGSGWCVSAVATAIWKTSHILDGLV